MDARSRLGGHGAFGRETKTDTDNEIDMTPMIDCIMRLIFFMTTRT